MKETTLWINGRYKSTGKSVITKLHTFWLILIRLNHLLLLHLHLLNDSIIPLKPRPNMTHRLEAHSIDKSQGLCYAA